MNRGEVRWVVQRVVDSTCRTLVVAAAVAGLAGVLHRVGPSAVLSWSVAVAAVAYTGVVLWDVVVARCAPEGVVTTGNWLMVLLFANSLVLTARELYSGVVIGLAALVLIRATMLEAGTRDPADASAPPSGPP